MGVEVVFETFSIRGGVSDGDVVMRGCHFWGVGLRIYGGIYRVVGRGRAPKKENPVRRCGAVATLRLERC